MSESYSYEYQYEYQYQAQAQVKMSASNDDEGSGLAKAFASKLGSAGAKLGKKAAQSETGKRATRAAIKGACDGVRDDMISKYGGSEPTPAPATAPKKEPAAETHEKKNTVPSWVDSDDEPEDSPAPVVYHHPPKPSLKDKLRFNINTKSSGSRKPNTRPPVKKSNKDRVYSSSAARKPDWDNLPRVQALYNYKADMKCDLEFRKGQVIQVVTRTDTQDDWWEGKLEGRIGIFPANYVKMLF